MIFDILTVLFFVFGFVLILRMVGEWRRDVLHGPYVTKEVPANDPSGAFGHTRLANLSFGFVAAAGSLLRSVYDRFGEAFEAADLKAAKRI
jgi:hypothetical protein